MGFMFLAENLMDIRCGIDTAYPSINQGGKKVSDSKGMGGVNSRVSIGCGWILNYINKSREGMKLYAGQVWRK